MCGWLILAGWLWWVFRDRSGLVRQSHELYRRRCGPNFE